MLTSIVMTFVLIVVEIHGQILVYHTENDEAIEKFDCIYHTYDDGTEIPYCRRPGRHQSLDRQRSECDNQGEKILISDLLDKNITPNNILQWSSSIEMIDVYAGIFYNRHSIDDDRFLCNCTKSGTFGKFCEYQLTHETKTFNEAIIAQFQQKIDGDSWNTQRYGKIICYETLPCLSGPLCLDWREICDGIQRCADGIDEENWNKLEFNECEDDEFRCTNGMCIAQEFWLDGKYDCMDWSDELFRNHGFLCPYEPNSMECDEHVCYRGAYSCGDGECISWNSRMAFQRIVDADNDCFSKRNLNYMCEASPHRLAWTLKDGLCWPDKGYDDSRYPPWNMINASNLTNEEKCQYLFRCFWSEGFEHDCPCNHQNCTKMMMMLCSSPGQLVEYPPARLISSNILFYHNYSISKNDQSLQIIALNGSIRCRGFSFQTSQRLPFFINMAMIEIPFVNYLLCGQDNPEYGHRDFFSFHKNDKFCWNHSLTFNGRPYAVNPDICSYLGECVSQYRIRDGIFDCLGDPEDETLIPEKNYCTGNVGRYRFQCYDDQYKCISNSRLGVGSPACLNKYDERWYGTGATLRFQLQCFEHLTDDCYRMKEYIQQSSSWNSSINSSLFTSQQQNATNHMPFRSYCNSFWNLDDHTDEVPSSCQYWVCQSHQYQCQTGQCIEVDWVCDGEWDCADASDEEAIVLIKKWSIHNARLSSLSSQLKKCRERYYKSPFSNICNTSFELGCYRSQVLNPLDIKSNRPCINLTQIGDGVEDCYNAYDEKNTFTTNFDKQTMWGFFFRCGNVHKTYLQACSPFELENCTDISCSKYRDKHGSCSGFKDYLCLEENRCKKGARCDRKFDCSYGEDEYWCSTGTSLNQHMYRLAKRAGTLQRDQYLSSTWYLPNNILESNQQQILESINNSAKNYLFKIHSYRCNRGVAVLHINEIQCLCPPAYYGRWCEFYSDRISIITHFDQKNFLNITLNNTFKIRTNLLFNKRIIDHHEFHIVPTLERMKIIKHRFYLLYSRSPQMLTHKRWRYLNRTDVINNHPYSVHFDVFVHEKNNSIEEIGSWHYPIYFDYLPAFRLALVLKFPTWFRNTTLNPCQSNSCNENSTCVPIFNQNRSYYCSCKSGYYGTNCNLYEHLCETYCASNALCRSHSYDIQDKTSKSYCICPIGYYGPHCNLKHHNCHPNPCLHNGSCFPNYDLSGEKPYVCNCSGSFDGDHCQNEKISVHIDLNLTNISSVRATVVQFYDYHPAGLVLLIRYQQVHHALPSTIIYDDSKVYAPEIGILKIYEDLSHPQLFIAYFLKGQPMIHITSSPQYCPHALSLLVEGRDTNQTVPSVFKYHHICRNDTRRYCFYDEDYLCICQKDHYRVDCFIQNIQFDHCDKCLSGGKCLQGDLKKPNDFICLCPSCHQGPQCEFSLQAFGFTFDSLLADSSKAVKIVYASVVCLFFIIGFFSNLCSLVTFKRPAPRKFGSGNYLFVLTCFNQAALFCLLFKSIQISFVLSSTESCKAVSYLFSVFTRVTYWLTSWVTVDRLMMIIFPTSAYLKNPCTAIGISIITSIILFGVHVHEIIYFTSIQHLLTGSLICVTNFDTAVISVYNRISTLVHHLCPFFIQIICITILIVLAARSRVKAGGKKITFGQVLKKQFQTQKELYVTPAIIILSALPQVILTFSFTCTQLTDWQRHTLLSSYLFSYTPQVLGFILHVNPSTVYRKEFDQTLLAQKLFKWIIDKKKRKVIISKTKIKT